MLTDPADKIITEIRSDPNWRNGYSSRFAKILRFRADAAQDMMERHAKLEPPEIRPDHSGTLLQITALRTSADDIENGRVKVKPSIDMEVYFRMVVEPALGI